jgi:biopolymer transport protein ExbD
MEMQLHKRTGQQAQAVVVDLNTTPLIDVMLVLLVLMIITLPAMTHATKLALAQGSRQAAPTPIALDIDFDGRIFADGHSLATDSDLEYWARHQAQLTPEREVKVSADRRVNYGRVAWVLARLQRNGLSKVAVNGLPD